MDKMSIEQEFIYFINNILEREKIDLIVCTERKATSIIRALIEEIDEPLQWKWDKVLSSLAICQFDWLSFSGTKVLLFDELVHHGKTLNNHKRRLDDVIKKSGRNGIEIITAGFTVWEKCEYKPDYAFFASVDAETYESKREKMVSMLQEYGSLLLDTEHVEISVRLQCGMRDFYDTLARDAEHGYTHSFISGAQRTNLTINYPDIINNKVLNSYLLPGSNTNNVVCKVRVVEKTHDKFSILPIFYPNIRCEFNDNWTRNLPDFIDKSYLLNASCSVLFYYVSLLASIELLRGIVSVLSELTRDERIVLEMPKEKVEHLISVFPRINIERLRRYISDIVSEAQMIKPKRGKQSAKALYVNEKKLLGLCGRVMNRMVLDNDYFPDGISWKQLMQIAEEENKKIGLNPQEYTVIVDRLIDNSLIVTSIRELISHNGDRYVIRTFVPEGEVVSDRIRQQLMVRNPECLILT